MHSGAGFLDMVARRSSWIVRLVLCVTWLLLPPVFAARMPRVLSLQHAVEIERGPKIDGKLNDQCWGENPVFTGFYDFHASDPRRAPVKTDLHVAFDQEGLYFAIRNYEDEPGKIRATATKRDDANLWRDDSIELYFSRGPEDPQKYRKFAINARGTHWDQIWKVPKDADIGWNAKGWRSGGSQDEKGWIVELMIPWSDLGGQAKKGDVWRFAAIRFSYTSGKRFASSAFRARFDNPDAFGYLHFGRIKSGDHRIKKLGQQIGGAWYLPLEGQTVLSKEGKVVVRNQGEILKAQKKKVRQKLRRKKQNLMSKHPELENAAERYREELAAVQTAGDSGPVFARRLAKLTEIERNLKKLSPETDISGPEKDPQKGVEVYTVKSPYLAGKNRIEVLLPEAFDQGKSYRVLYVLPVNTGIGGRWGDCLQIVKQTGLHNKHELICVTMAFDTTPWYGAHDSDPSIRHEDYIKKLVIPLIEKRYPVVEPPDGRLLLGFSKSGWGSFSLILRNPDFFGYACSWDAPLIMDENDYGIWSTEKHYGTKENFLNYLPKKLVVKNAEEFRDKTRLVLLGHQFFGNRWACPKDESHTASFHEQLQGLKIRHAYDNTVKAPHSWNQQWLRIAIEKIVTIAESGK
ncbi:MAG: hypothetical protein KGZ25_01425 [Planctomycetes bacterium]|nr:hypothetical protein [Planctomycetota bacterium]